MRRKKPLQILAMALVLVTLLTSIIVVSISASIPPEVKIISPGQGASILADCPVNLISLGNDPDGRIDEYMWSVDGLAIGHGKELQGYKFRKAGEHTITVIAIDNDGLYAEANVKVHVIVEPVINLNIKPVINLNINPAELKNTSDNAMLSIEIKSLLASPSTIVEIEKIDCTEGIFIEEHDKKDILTSFEVMSGKPEVKTINVSAIWPGEYSIKLRGYYWPENDPSNKQWIESSEVSFKVTEEAVPKSPRFVIYDRFLQLMFGLFLFTVIISFIFFLRGNFDKKHIIPMFAVFLIIIVIGYLFVVSQPSIHLNDIGDSMIGDKILVSGESNNLNGHELKINLITPSYSPSKHVKIEDNKFNVTFETSPSDGGKCAVLVACLDKPEIFAIKSFHLFSSLVEKISTEKSVYIKGSPIKVLVSLKNPHKEKREINLNLQLDNKVVKTKSVSIPSEGFKNINFTLDNVDVGMHEVSVGGYEASFEVKPVPFIRLNPIVHDVGIGNPLTISGTSNLPDDTKIEITIKDGVILAQKTASVTNGRFSIEIDTSNAKEGIYNIIAEEPVRRLSDTAEVKLYVQYWDIKTIDLSISPSVVIIGDKVTVEVTLKNTGNIVGTRDVILNIDGRAIQSKTVTMHPNQMKKVSFDISTTQSDVGRHTVSVDDKTAVLTVKPTPRIDLDAIGDVKIGNELTVSGSTNLEDGTELLIVIESESGAYNFEPVATAVKNGRFTEKLDTSDAIEGIYKITVKDAKAIHGAKDVRSVFLFSTKPGISLSLSVSSKEILVGETEKVFVRVTNSGDKKEAISLSLKMDEMLKDTQTITVEAKDFNTATFEIHNPDIGTHIIDVNGYKTMFSVTAPTPILPHISTDRLSIDLYSTKTVVSRGENIIVTLSAVNKITNDKDLHLQLILAVPSGISATSSEGAFSIAGGQATFDKVLKPGETISGITLNLVPNEVGSYTIKGDVIYQVGDEKFDEEEMCLSIFVGS